MQYKPPEQVVFELTPEENLKLLNREKLDDPEKEKMFWEFAHKAFSVPESEAKNIHYCIRILWPDQKIDRVE